MPYAFANGVGTETDPYQVATAADLNGVRDYLTAHFIQTADIDLSGYTNWVPIGDFNNTFTGLYDGNGKSISNMTTTGKVVVGNYNNNIGVAGLFARIGEGGIVKKLNIDNFTLYPAIAPTSYAYAFAAANNGYIDQCFAAGTIDGSDIGTNYCFMGGISYTETPGRLSNCYAICSIYAYGNKSYAGGIGAHYAVTGARIENCYAVVTPNDSTGGIMGIGGIITGYRSSNFYNSDLLTADPSYTTYDGVPKTTAEMKRQETFVGWDFEEIWGIDPAINDGYPYLLAFSQAEPVEPIIDDVIPSYPPASYIKLQFQAGDSEKYDMGIFYADKTRFRVGDPGAKVNARNSVGKYLRDQTYDERNNYSPMRLDDLLKKILTGAGITDFYVAPNSTQIGMQFAPNKSILDGIEEILAYAPGWVIREEVTGRVVIGPKDDPEFTQPSRYTFQRDRDIFSREQIKDDQRIYGRVCVHVADFSIKVYRAVTSALGWLPPAQKTYYQVVPDGTTSQEAAALATELADAMADSGEVETFVCPFRPQIIPGDEAEILDSDGATFLGVITQVKHDFGAGGFYTTITVDSGGRIGRPRFKDLVNALNSVTTMSHKF